ncbi:hypothetical protein AAVH_30525, partial [Aphelenchoides avenae]
MVCDMANVSTEEDSQVKDCEEDRSVPVAMPDTELCHGQRGAARCDNDRQQNIRDGRSGCFNGDNQPRRSRNAIEVIEALDDNEQKARLYSKVGMLVNMRFEVQQMIDQGSYGQIFVGFDHLLLRKVAVKFDEGKRKAERTSSSKRNHLKDEFDIYATIR